jgi:predicted kinase
MTIIIFGLPGSGKSFFAERLAKMLNAGYLSSDQLRKEMYAVRTYSFDEKMAVYDKMKMAMHEAIQNKVDLILDGSFYKESIRQKFKNEIAKGQAIWFIEVIADESLIRDRLSRPRAFSEADYEVYKKIKGEWEPMKEDHLIIQSTNSNVEEMLKKAKDHLSMHHDQK